MFRERLVAAVVAAGVLAMLLVAWASTTGPDQLFGPGTGRMAGGGVIAPSVTPGSGRTLAPPPPQRPVGAAAQSIGPWVRALAMALIIVAFVLFVVLLVWLVLHRVQRRRRLVVEASPEPPLDVRERVAAALGDGFAEQRRLLASGMARSAIVACWEGFAVRLEEAGVPRQPWETPTETTSRVLRSLARGDAEDQRLDRAVTLLAALYREARFSRHDLGEGQRELALDAFDEIHDLLAVRR